MADEEGSTVSDAQLLADIKSRNTDVTNLINRKDKINAMKACLKNPPVQTKTPEVKVNKYK